MSHLLKYPSIVRLLAAGLAIFLLAGCEKKVVREDVPGAWIGRAESPHVVPELANLKTHLLLQDDGTFSLVGYPRVDTFEERPFQGFISGTGKWEFKKESSRFIDEAPFLRFNEEAPVGSISRR